MTATYPSRVIDHAVRPPPLGLNAPFGRVTEFAQSPPKRSGGYCPIRDYAVLGDGRTVALVAKDGRVDWWPVPALDAPPVCAAILEPEAGGYLQLAPAGPYKLSRCYIEDTNVLQTTYVCATGTARVTQALNSGTAGRLPWNELVLLVEGLDGTVQMDLDFLPGDRFGQASPFTGAHDGTPVVRVGDQMLAVVIRGVELTELGPVRITGSAHVAAGERALVAVIATDDEPLFIPAPEEVEHRLYATISSWERWSASLPSEGDWVGAVRRSALALKTLFFEPTGAISAAATTSLPERVGGQKNYDYRYGWLRDTSFTLDAFMNLALREETHAAVSWMINAIRRTAPQLHVFYTLSGDVPGEEVDVDVPGYQRSRPVRAGNAASSQTQLGVYGDLFDTMFKYITAGHVLDDSTGRLLADLANQCCDAWRQKDSGIWELPDLQHYTISKIGCWVALDRACKLAERGQMSARSTERWRHEAHAIKDWVDANCWSNAQRSYTFYAGTEKLDAAVLLAGRTGFERGERLAGTIEAVLRQLGKGPMIYRYTGMQEHEGAFVACTFWLVSALVHNGQRDRAAELMDQGLSLANDLGLLSEQISPATGDLLGNVPQGLSHLALINAVHALEGRL